MKNVSPFSFVKVQKKITETRQQGFLRPNVVDTATRTDRATRTYNHIQRFRSDDWNKEVIIRPFTGMKHPCSYNQSLVALKQCFLNFDTNIYSN